MNYRMIARRLRAMADKLEVDQSKMNDAGSLSISMDVDSFSTGGMEVSGDAPMVSEEEAKWLSSHGFKQEDSGDKDKVIYSKETTIQSINSKIILVKKWRRNEFGVRNQRVFQNSDTWTILFPGTRTEPSSMSREPESLSGVRRYKHFLYREDYIHLDDQEYRSVLEREIKRIQERCDYFKAELEMDQELMEFYRTESM